jgi:hypothetical protein
LNRRSSTEWTEKDFEIINEALWEYGYDLQIIVAVEIPWEREGK